MFSYGVNFDKSRNRPIQMIENRLGLFGGKSGIYLSITILLQCILTIVHHLYGEFVLYGDGTRLHAALLAPFALLLTFAPLKLHRNNYGLRMFLFWTVSIWVLALGVFEGFWNHIALWFVTATGMTDVYSFAFVRSIPGDLVFELTGAAQFVITCVLVALLMSSCQCLIQSKKS